MKRFLQLLMAACAVLLIAACGDNGGSEDDTTEDADTEESTEDETSEDNSTEESSADSDSTTEDEATGQEPVTEENDDATEDEDAAEDSATENSPSDDNMTDGQEETKTFVMEDSGFKNTQVYTYVDDEVIHQTSETIMSYEAIGVPDEEAARAELGPIVETYENTEGIEHSIEYTEDGIIENLAVDYEIADIREVAQLQGAEFEGDTEATDFISMTQTEEMLLAAMYRLEE